MFWVWSIIKCGLENQWTFDDFPSSKALFIGDVHGCSLVMFDSRRVPQYHPERKFCPMSSAFGLKMSAENRENPKIIEDPHGISHHFPQKIPFLSMAGFQKIPLGPDHPRGIQPRLRQGFDFCMFHRCGWRHETSLNTLNIHADRWDRWVMFHGFSGMLWYIIWLVVSNMAGWYSIYGTINPSHRRTPSFFKMVKTTNQIWFDVVNLAQPLICFRWFYGVHIPKLFIRRIPKTLYPKFDGFPTRLQFTLL